MAKRAVKPDAEFQAWALRKLDTLKRGQPRALAAHLEAKEQAVSLWRARKRPVPAKYRDLMHQFFLESRSDQPRQSGVKESLPDTTSQGGPSDGNDSTEARVLQLQFQNLQLAQAVEQVKRLCDDIEKRLKLAGIEVSAIAGQPAKHLRRPRETRGRV